jgi:hypothetical protein
VILDEEDDILGAGPGRKEFGHALGLELGDVVGRDDPAAEDLDVGEPFVIEQIGRASCRERV